MSGEVVQVDKYEPDYSRKCCNCGQKPVVTAVKDGKVVYKGDMCGPCTWGESAMINPENWNK